MVRLFFRQFLERDLSEKLNFFDIKQSFQCNFEFLRAKHDFKIETFTLISNSELTLFCKNFSLVRLLDLVRLLIFGKSTLWYAYYLGTIIR